MFRLKIVCSVMKNMKPKKFKIVLSIASSQTLQDTCYYFSHTMYSKLACIQERLKFQNSSLWLCPCVSYFWVRNDRSLPRTSCMGCRKKFWRPSLVETFFSPFLRWIEPSIVFVKGSNFRLAFRKDWTDFQKPKYYLENQNFAIFDYSVGSFGRSWGEKG